MANLKSETISQFDGFGNRRAKSLGEHFRSLGYRVSAFGMTIGQSIYAWYTGNTTTWVTTSALSRAEHWTNGKGISQNGGGILSGVFNLDRNGQIVFIPNGTSTPEVVYPVQQNSSHFNSGLPQGMISDQKGRLLYPGYRYLGMFDPSTSNLQHTVTLTNGSSTVTKTAGADFVAGMGTQKTIMRIYDGSTQKFVRVTSYSSGTAVTIFGTWTGTTGSYTAESLLSWNDYWKDFGANLGGSGLTSDGEAQFIPTETYEDTVLFGRKNVITSLSTTTDTVTTDASPAFTMPTNYDILAIHKGSNGILLGYNFNKKGVLVLWDNYSDRSIAPWIELPDRLISMCKYNGGWIVITSKEFYFTNGYSLTLLTNGILDMQLAPLATTTVPQTSFTTENDLYFLADFSLHGKRRAGLYRMNLETKLVEYVPRQDLNQKDTLLLSLHYGAGNASSRIFVGSTTAIEYIATETQPNASSFIFNPVGAGSNKKYLEGVKLDIGIWATYYTADSPFSFTVTVKACKSDQQMFNYGQVKTLQTVANQIVVDETAFEEAEVGDEIEFLNGGNAGYTRNIVSKSGTGATVTYTFDRDLPSLSSANDYFFRTKFRLIRSKTFTNITEIDVDDLWFNSKNKPKGKKFLIKVDIEGATIPLELRPAQVIYDDMGVI